MRLHQLSVTAFGPFVDTAEVDFDALSDAGLFLLSGATGAGKSSVLDAVCFALYGAVPGDRQHAGRLRSDQAPPGLAPSVTLEATVSGRRLRVVRSPAWDRPKKRGTGTTREQARVTVSERIDGAWTPVTSRLDEAGDLLGALLGMTLDQFCQVVLLPQGQFQAFLRADSPSRHQLLSRLFRTGRFERVEGWLRDHRLALRRTSEQHAEVVAELASRLSEASTTGLPDDSDVAGSAADGTLAGWASAVREAARARRTTTAAAVAEAGTSTEKAYEAWQTAVGLAARRARVVQAAANVERLERDAAVHARDRDRLDSGRRAFGLRPLARLVDERRDSLGRHLAESDLARDELERAGLDPEDLPGELERAGEALAALTALLPSEEQLLRLRQEESETESSLAAMSDAQALVEAEAESLRALRAGTTHDLAQTGVTATELREAEVAVATAQAVADAHVRLTELEPERLAVVAEHDAAVRRLLDLRERLLDLRERRIAGMAAELAGELVVGGDCPVCGSEDHPRPAAVVAGHPDASAERAAQRAVDDAQVAEHALDLRSRELDADRAAARRAAGTGDATAAVQRLEAAGAQLLELRQRAERQDALMAQADAARTRAAELEQATADHRVRRAELGATLERARAEAQRLAEAVAAVRGEHPVLGDAVTELEGRRELLRAAHLESTRREAAEVALAEAERALAHAAAEAGFPDAAAARAAELTEAQLGVVESRVREHDVALDQAHKVLAEPDAGALLASPEPDVPACEARHRAAADDLERLRAASELATRRDDRVADLTARLLAALDEWTPVRDELALATAVSSFADGKAPDNRLQMRLSAYVLAHRLSQVVAAANARLLHMSDRRYILEHVGRRGAGERRGGLSLVVVDDWSGESRDPATLSGGESFVVSLALALGLADVVSQEAGGVDLQTLFVDEGFGALDAETLDDVLDILDSLRENGRAVGVVSHVAEMRDRIPTQLVVGKARTGSTLRVVG
ncbi:MAG: SMC family ATPase [Nocardioides sp.]